MNTTISGKMQYLDDLKILMLNNLPYNDCSDFHIKKTDELLNVIKEHKPYINKITFYLVSSYNSGEASFLYDNDDIYFVIFNVESSLESTYLKKGNSMIYNIKAKQLNFKTIEEEQFFIDKYPHNYDLKTHILDEIDMLMLRNINEIYFKHTLVDKEEESHVLEVKGNYISNNQITINIYEKQGFNVYIISVGDVFRETVKKEYLKRYPDRINVSLADIQNDKEFMAKLQSIDGLIDDEIARKGKEINEKERPNDVYIIDSRLAWSNVPDSYAIRLTVNEAIAGKRVFYDTTRGSEDQYETVDEAIQKTRKRKLGEIERYKEKYGINLLDENNYDLVVDTSYTNTQELADIIVSGEEAYRTGKSYPKYWANPTCAER